MLVKATSGDGQKDVCSLAVAAGVYASGGDAYGLRATALTLELCPQLLPEYIPHRASFHFSRAAIELCKEVGLFLKVLDFEALEKDFDDLGATVLIELGHPRPRLPHFRILDPAGEEKARRAAEPPRLAKRHPLRSGRGRRWADIVRQGLLRDNAPWPLVTLCPGWLAPGPDLPNQAMMDSN